MYALLGKAVWRYCVTSVRRRYRMQLRIGAGLAVLGVGAAAAYLISRDVPEG